MTIFLTNLISRLITKVNEITYVQSWLNCTNNPPAFDPSVVTPPRLIGTLRVLKIKLKTINYRRHTRTATFIIKHK